MQGDVVWRLFAWPLTPIHVGDGSVLGKDSYDIRNGCVCRFHPNALIADADPETLRLFNQELDRGDLDAALQRLRDAANDRHIVERLPMTEEARKALGGGLRSTLRRGEIQTFIRSGGVPFLPGSSIKGALRTALVSSRLSKQPEEEARRAARAGSKAAESLALVLREGATETDPLRDVYVPDVPIGQGALIVDRVFHWKPEREITKIQLHVERLRSRADDRARAGRIDFEIRIVSPEQQSARRERDSERVPTVPVSAEELWDAVRSFYWGRFDAERERFWRRRPDVEQNLERALTFPTSHRTVSEHDHRRNVRVALIRLGRFGHFESKSVDHLRQGDVPQRKIRRAPGEEGATRMLASVSSSDRRESYVPYGWMLLTLRKDN